MQNTGKTPAEDVTIAAIAEVRYGELPKELALGIPVSSLQEEASRISVAPNLYSIAFRAFDAIKKEDFPKFDQSGGWPRIYVFGRVTYRTVFGGISGETSFCRVWLTKPFNTFVGCIGHPDVSN
jgi:hypothetical protein